MRRQTVGPSPAGPAARVTQSGSSGVIAANQWDVGAPSPVPVRKAEPHMASPAGAAAHPAFVQAGRSKVAAGARSTDRPVRPLTVDASAPAKSPDARRSSFVKLQPAGRGWAHESEHGDGGVRGEVRPAAPRSSGKRWKALIVAADDHRSGIKHQRRFRSTAAL